MTSFGAKEVTKTETFTNTNFWPESKSNPKHGAKMKPALVTPFRATSGFSAEAGLVRGEDNNYMRATKFIRLRQRKIYYPLFCVNPRLCLISTASGVELLFDIFSQMGSTSGPSRSPAPSHPQHHTIKNANVSQEKNATIGEEDLPYSGPGLKSSNSDSSSTNSLS